MPELQQAEERKLAPAPLLIRRRMLLGLGWGLLLLSLIFLAVQVLWMWQRLGRGAPLIAIGLFMDAVVGLGLIIFGSRLRPTG